MFIWEESKNRFGDKHRRHLKPKVAPWVLVIGMVIYIAVIVPMAVSVIESWR